MASPASKAVVAPKAMVGEILYTIHEPWEEMHDELDQSDTEVIKSSSIIGFTLGNRLGFAPKLSHVGL